ncbi:hypothetical protein ACE3MS_12135 [Paenibacillus dendritiformis]|uniref:hypothetical protein n=1 Tax=Paenibacillus dendritiformis TaxID=130049 RepID=UPI00365FC106
MSSEHRMISASPTPAVTSGSSKNNAKLHQFLSLWGKLGDIAAKIHLFAYLIALRGEMASN